MKLMPAHRQWRETQDQAAYRTWAVDFKSRVAQSLQQWRGLAGYEAGKLLRKPSDKAELWWYFLDHPEVPQDFNQAERALTGLAPWGIATSSGDQT